jgi:uncharacterized protein YcbX
MYISALFYYPIKSCAGCALNFAELTPRGIKNDRCLQIVNSNGDFLTQRELPQMALIQPTLLDEHWLILSAPAMPELRVPVGESDKRRMVSIWGDWVLATEQDTNASEWLSAFLQAEVQLVRIADGHVRSCDPRYARHSSDQTGFADGYPILLTNNASLDDLNARLQAKGEPAVEMARFRPNVVVSGASAFAEDDWKQLQTGQVVLDVVKPCARCVIVTTNQKTAERGKEPLRTLSEFRNWNGKVLFGQNVCHQGRGSLQLGQKLTRL